MVDAIHYLDPVLDDLQQQWPGNHIVNIVCHGHSVPAGYFATPYVNALEAYPHLLFQQIKQRFPFAVANVIVSAIGGENAQQGAGRFAGDVLNHCPRVVTIDYGLNDRGTGLGSAYDAWKAMIEQALAQDVKVILLTPSWDNTYFAKDAGWQALEAHAEQIRTLAGQYGVGLADVFARFYKRVRAREDLVALLSHVNHPSADGHALIADEIGKYFLAR